jgi:hypothetical protein
VIGHVGRRDLDGHYKAQGVNEQMTLAASDLLAIVSCPLPGLIDHLHTLVSTIAAVGAAFLPAERRN